VVAVAHPLAFGSHLVHEEVPEKKPNAAHPDSHTFDVLAQAVQPPLIGT